VGCIWQEQHSWDYASWRGIKAFTVNITEQPGMLWLENSRCSLSLPLSGAPLLFQRGFGGSPTSSPSFQMTHRRCHLRPWALLLSALLKAVLSSAGEVVAAPGAVPGSVGWEAHSQLTPGSHPAHIQLTPHSHPAHTLLTPRSHSHPLTLYSHPAHTVLTPTHTHSHPAHTPLTPPDRAGHSPQQPSPSPLVRGRSGYAGRSPLALPIPDTPSRSVSLKSSCQCLCHHHWDGFCIPVLHSGMCYRLYNPFHPGVVQPVKVSASDVRRCWVLANDRESWRSSAACRIRLNVFMLTVQTSKSLSIIIRSYFYYHHLPSFENKSLISSGQRGRQPLPCFPEGRLGTGIPSGLNCKQNNTSELKLS